MYKRQIYGNGFIANNGIAFSVRKGEIHAMAGENGAGKSTLMKVLFGEETPEEGLSLIHISAWRASARGAVPGAMRPLPRTPSRSDFVEKRSVNYPCRAF